MLRRSGVEREVRLGCPVCKLRISQRFLNDIDQPGAHVMWQAGRRCKHPVEAEIGKLGMADIVGGGDARRRSACAFLGEPYELPEIAARQMTRDRNVDAKAGIGLATNDGEMGRRAAGVGREKLRLDTKHRGRDPRHRQVVAAGGREEWRPAGGLPKRLQRRERGLLADD